MASFKLDKNGKILATQYSEFVQNYRKMARKDIAVAAIAWIMMMKIAPKLLLDGDGEDDTRN